MTASTPAFELEIVSQGWITDDEDSARHDLCSHGEVRLVLGGRVIATPEQSDVTLSTSALALLRTLERDHSRARPVADYLLLHCGMLSMTSCPHSIDWAVMHLPGGRVRLHDVVDAEGKRYPDLEVDLDEAEYRRVIVAFAEKAKEPFYGVDKQFEVDDPDRELYAQFWDEYDALLDRHSG